MPYPRDVPEQLEMLEARLGRGTYTDDTQMMIALAESLLENGRVDEAHLGRAFVAAYDPRRGYGSGTEAVLALIRDGVSATDAALQAFEGGGSMGNGAAMRIARVAVRFADDQKALLDSVRRSAVVTHAHRLGVDAALRGEDIIGAIAGARDGARAIPARWLAALEDGHKGRSHVEVTGGSTGVLSFSPYRPPGGGRLYGLNEEIGPR